MKKTEEALITLLEVGNKVKDAIADDGRINLKESIGISMKAVALIGVFKSLPEIRVELKESKPEDRMALVEVFKEHFDLPNDVAEKNVEDGITVLVELANMVFGKKV